MDFCIPYGFLLPLAIIGWPGVLYDALFGPTLSSLGSILLGVIVNGAIFYGIGASIDYRRRITNTSFWRRASFYYPVGLLSIALIGYVAGIIEAYFRC